MKNTFKTPKTATKTAQKPRETLRAKKNPLDEKINGVSVYTAVYKVNRSDELLEFLLRKCNTSRNNIKSLLVRKQVLVNGKVVTQYNYILAKDDEVRLARKPVKDGVIATQPQDRREKRGAKLPEKAPARRLSLKILYEDEDFLVIDKPTGLLSVESDKEHECAYAYAVDYLQKKSKTARPFVLHRIDKETSGVLVFAKNVKIHSMLRMHWNERVQLREYYAVVEGTPQEREGTITCYLKENANNLVYATHDPSGQKAVTHYEVVESNGEYSLLRVRIDTGRKNQIRVQMKWIGHAVVGDDKYGSEKNPLERLGLHASKLSFIHPVSKEVLTFTSPVPATFRGLF